MRTLDCIGEENTSEELYTIRPHTEKKAFTVADLSPTVEGFRSTRYKRKTFTLSKVRTRKR